MATAVEHMAADLAYALASTDEGAVAINLDGTQLNAFVDDKEFTGSPYEGSLLSRKGVLIMAGAITEPVPEQEMVLNGLRHTVEAVNHQGPGFEIILVRFSS